VDDIPGNIDILQGILSPDYRVKVAAGGARALEITAQDDPPDLILLDVMMPGMDGYEVIRRLKEEPRTESIPVLFITAKEAPEDEQLGFKGCVDYITKPVSAPRVRARVRTLALRDRNRNLETQVRERTHHERWDGTGYLRGLSGAAIPLAGRIVAVKEVRLARRTRPHGPRLPGNPGDDPIQVLRTHRLGQVGVEPRQVRPALVIRRAEAGDGDQDNILQARMGPQGAGHRVAVHGAGQADVAQDEVRHEGLGLGQAGRPVEGDLHLVAQ
jgi:CheY-like chemotaxis protein